jgi:hypothetical protein
MSISTFNQLRVVPRLMMLTYMWATYTVSVWFMNLPEPTTSQSTFASVVWGAGAAWFGIYINGKPDK